MEHAQFFCSSFWSRFSGGGGLFFVYVRISATSGRFFVFFEVGGTMEVNFKKIRAVLIHSVIEFRFQ